MKQPDDRDRLLISRRQCALGCVDGPRVGDYVSFPCGHVRRVSHNWGDTVQTSDGGSFYLGDGYVSFSGGLFPGVPVDSLADTGMRRDGAVWIFHHDDWRADNGVESSIPFRVYACSAKMPE